jgi:hypothetical protein
MRRPRGRQSSHSASPASLVLVACSSRICRRLFAVQPKSESSMAPTGIQSFEALRRPMRLMRGGKLRRTYPRERSCAPLLSPERTTSSRIAFANMDSTRGSTIFPLQVCPSQLEARELGRVAVGARRSKRRAGSRETFAPRLNVRRMSDLGGSSRPSSSASRRLKSTVERRCPSSGNLR